MLRYMTLTSFTKNTSWVSLLPLSWVQLPPLTHSIEGTASLCLRLHPL